MPYNKVKATFLQNSKRFSHCVLNLRRERLCLFFSFLLLLRPALDGDSSFTLPWWDTLDEPCELKWVGTWRARPPWEANVALQPPTTHCRKGKKGRKGEGRSGGVKGEE